MDSEMEIFEKQTERKVRILSVLSAYVYIGYVMPLSYHSKSQHGSCSTASVRWNYEDATNLSRSKSNL